MFEITFDPPALTEVGNPKNSVIINQGQESKGYYVFYMDNLKHIKQLDKDSRHLCPSRLPVEIFQPDFIYTAEKIRLLNLESEKNFLGFIMPDQALKDRIDGKLPLWYIGNDAFIYDVIKEQLIPVDGKTLAIPLSKFEPIDDDDVDVRGAFYNTTTRQIAVQAQYRDRTKENEVKYIMIFGPMEVDPVGVARKEGKPDSAYLNLKEGRCLRENRTLLNDPPNTKGVIPTICETNKPSKERHQKKRGRTHSK